MITISLSNNEKARFRSWTKSVTRENREICRRNIIRATEMMVKWSKMQAPVSRDIRKGRRVGGVLRSSIQSSYTTDQLGSRVIVNAHYAPYMEFGTGRFVSVMQGYEDYAMQFKGAGIREVNIQPRAFFFKTFERVNKALINDFKKMGYKVVAEEE